MYIYIFTHIYIGLSFLRSTHGTNTPKEASNMEQSRSQVVKSGEFIFVPCNEKFLVAYLSSLGGANNMMSGHAASSYS